MKEKKEKKEKSGLEKLPNIGPELARQLKEVGITDIDDLASAGSKGAWLKIREIDESACIHRLYALEGAILGIKKSMLPPDLKKDLKAFYDAEKK